MNDIPFATDMVIFDTMLTGIQETYLETDPQKYVSEGDYLYVSKLIKELHDLQKSKWYKVVFERCTDFLTDILEFEEFSSLIEERMKIYKKIEPNGVKAVFFLYHRLFKKGIPEIFIPECGCGVPCDDTWCDVIVTDDDYDHYGVDPEDFCCLPH